MFRESTDSTLNWEDSTHKIMVATIAVIGMFSEMPQMAQTDHAKAKMESMKGEVKAKGKTKAAGERTKGKAKELKAKTE